MSTGPIIIVDDDEDDHLLVKEIMEDLQVKNKLICFTSGQKLIDELDKDDDLSPFIIISDVNLKKMDGFELREKIRQSHAKKMRSIPFIFWSGAASEAQVQHAYDLEAHGFFIKQGRYDDMKRTLDIVIKYWSQSQTP